MTPQTTTPTMEQAWQAAIAQADSLSLADNIWERPQVQGFTIDGPTSRDLDGEIWIKEIETGSVTDPQPKIIYPKIRRNLPEKRYLFSLGWGSVTLPQAFDE